LVVEEEKHRFCCFFLVCWDLNFLPDFDRI